jgi:hypothetical protein
MAIPTLLIICPAFRKVEFSIQQGVPTCTCISQKDAYLTVFDAPCGAAVLPLNSHRLASLFKKAGFIDHHYRIGRRKRLEDILT